MITFMMTFLLATMLAGIPILLCIALVGFIVMAALPGVVMPLFAQKMFGALDSYTLLALPYFILAGSIMTAGGISQQLVDFARLMVGRDVLLRVEKDQAKAGTPVLEVEDLHVRDDRGLEAVRGVLSHHLVIREGKIANYHPYPPTPWNASPRDEFGTPGPYEDAVQGLPIFEENGQAAFKGIDIMRTVRSFDPCLPCGVHMYVGNGKVIEQRHSPMLGLGAHGGTP